MAEPPSTARVVLYTTRGQLEVELWAKEMPRAVRNFLTQAQSGFYNDSYFHRIESSFVQAGPENDTTIYGGPFELETNGRIRFSRRGIVACAGSPAGQTSQLIFTTQAAPELASQCTILGRLVGDSVYVLAEINEAEKTDGIPVHPVRIDRVEIKQAFFDNLPPIPTAPTDNLEPKSKPKPKRQIRVFEDEDDEPPLILKKKNPRLAVTIEPSAALKAVLAFEKDLPELIAQDKLC